MNILRTPIRSLFLTAISFILLLTSCADQADPKPKGDGPANPGWASDWLKQKKEAGVDIPDNLRAQWYRSIKPSQARDGESNLKDIEELGPDFVGGRIRAFVVDYANPDRYIAGGISGGIWESLNRGDSWTNLTPENQHLNVTSITQSPFDHDVFYFTTGEPTGNSADISGAGIFKSTDGGQTFEQLPSSDISWFFSTWRIKHSLTDSNTFYVASTFGLFASRDGGEFYDVLIPGESNDIEIFPDGQMYASFNDGGVYYSPDGSEDSFVELSPDFPSHGRCELAISANNPDVIAAALENPDDGRVGHIFYSEDKGQNWTEIPNPVDRGFGSYFAWYCNSLYIHPSDPDYLIYGASDLAYTTDRGQTWNSINNVHADVHVVMPSPTDEDEIIVCSDGGVDIVDKNVSEPFGTSLNNGLNVTQFYTGVVTANGSLIAGTQDNGTWYYDKNTGEFSGILGGDGSHCDAHPFDSNEIYASWQNSNIYRITDLYSNPDYAYISNDIVNSGDDTWFIAPLQLNHDKPWQVFAATQDRIWWSQSRGDFWKPLTGELNNPFRMAFVTENNVSTGFLCGGEGLFYRIDGIQNHVAGTETDLRSSVPWEVNSSFLREMTLSGDKQTLFVAVSSYSGRPRVWRVDDIMSANPLWKNIQGDLPTFLPVNTIAVDRKDPSLLAIGTDYGVFTSKDGGQHWTLETSIPRTVIYQLRILDDNTLYIFTHGRGIFKSKLERFSSTNSVAQSVEFEMSPNPAQDFIQLTAPEEIDAVRIFSYDGKIVYQNANRGMRQINIASLQTGNYLLEITTRDGKIGSRQFVKK